MGDIKREKLIVALGYVRTLMQEIADDAEEQLLSEALARDIETRSALSIYEECARREQRQWALERIVTLTADIEKLGGDSPGVAERMGEEADTEEA